MKKNAFIIFIKNSGEVKSRIAQEVGREKAIAIYEELLDHTFLLAQKVKSFASIYLYFSEENKDLRWQKIANTFYIQNEGDLGVKMATAMKNTFIDHDKVVLIGSDCPYITADHIAESFDQLSIAADITIGPAIDGGYYLIGMTRFHEHIFNDIPWSTDAVYQATVDRIYDERLSMATLDRLSDIDYYKDYQDWKNKID